MAKVYKPLYPAREVATINCFLVVLEKEISKAYQYYLIVFKNNSTRACWISDDYSQLGPTHLVGYLSSHIKRTLVE